MRVSGAGWGTCGGHGDSRAGHIGLQGFWSMQSSKVNRPIAGLNDVGAAAENARYHGGLPRQLHRSFRAGGRTAHSRGQGRRSA